VINKNQQANHKAKIKVEGGAKYTRAEAFAFDGSAAKIRPVSGVAVQGGEVTLPMPALSAALIVLRP
jgi:hypothetical protein